MTVTDLETNSGDALNPFMQTHFSVGQHFQLFVSWDVAAPGVLHGTRMLFMEAMSDVRVTTDTYIAHREALGYNYLFSPSDGSGVYAYADLYGVVGAPAPIFHPYYFEMSLDYGAGALPPLSVPSALPTAPASGPVMIAFGTSFYENPQFVSAVVTSSTAVPEPATLCLMGIGLLSGALGVRRYRRQ